jgi:hypothetical protein
MLDLSRGLEIMYEIKWRYEIMDSMEHEFMAVYDRNGKWSDFFSRSVKYLGSVLKKESENVYLLINSWKDKESYIDFIKENEDEYKELSRKYSRLYTKEERIHKS